MSPSPTLTDLPPEIVLEITASHPHPFSGSFVSPLLRYEHGAQARQDRHQILHPLSQTCTRLRGTLLPLLYERFDATKARFEEIYTESELAVLIFPYIKSVHISMRSWTPESDLPRILLFVQFLRALPNLDGLQIDHPPRSIYPILKYAFALITLPAVTQLCVPELLNDAVFHVFPNVRVLACPMIFLERRSWTLDLDCAKKRFPMLEALAGVRLSDRDDALPRLLDGFTRSFPRLRGLSVSTSLTHSNKDLLLQLSALPLTHLSIVHETVENFLVPDHAREQELLSLEEVVACGVEVLKRAAKSESDSGKTRRILRVWSYDFALGFDAVPHVVYVET